MPDTKVVTSHAALQDLGRGEVYIVDMAALMGDDATTEPRDKVFQVSISHDRALGEFYILEDALQYAEWVTKRRGPGNQFKQWIRSCLDPTVDDLLNCQLDITRPGFPVEVKTVPGRMWVNIGPVCVLRVCMIEKLSVKRRG